eukprot:CAMPEP_0180092178 /NCGR_PEP_ID=MMETSP0985-20121206/24378_1 /TAXON_ID=483367 /ORGANISM="non described non described, Strain CCMP 2436" /LENGTH=45 /DNA_ID= /DNA_START= /DNA_END= /DNA_ORIENTATION=
MRPYADIRVQGGRASGEATRKSPAPFNQDMVGEGTAACIPIVFGN